MSLLAVNSVRLHNLRQPPNDPGYTGASLHDSSMRDWIQNHAIPKGMNLIGVRTVYMGESMPFPMQERVILTLKAIDDTDVKNPKPLYEFVLNHASDMAVRSLHEWVEANHQ